MIDIKIRLAIDADFESIYSIWLDGIDNSFDRNSIWGEVLRQKFANNFFGRQDIFNFWVAEGDGVILGWQSLIKTSLNPFREELYAESSTYIDKNCQLKGLGQHLIKYVIEEAEKSNLEYITGFVTVSNYAARAITKATGWIEVGEVPPSKKGIQKHPKLFLIRPV